MAKRKRKKGRSASKPTKKTERSNQPELPAADEAVEAATVEDDEAGEEAEPSEAELAAQASGELSEAPPDTEDEVDEATAPSKEREPKASSSPDTSSSAWSKFLALRGEPLPSFLRHIHPKSVLRRSLEPTRTFGLGLLSLYMAIVLAVTGVLLMVYYVPSAEGAYGSIQDLHAVVPFGGLVRNIHRWAGHAMVLLVALHLLRTLLTGSYKAGRRGVWTAGVWLLILTLAFAFTGYLLPWDQLSFWAVSIGGHLAGNVPLLGDALSRALLGGEDVSEATLVRFYALHVGILPLVTTVFVALHLYRFRRAGGLARPKDAIVERVSAWPHLYERELALLALTLVLLIVAGVLFDAPLGSQPDIEHPDNPSKAPWYFLGLQELVSYSTLVGGVLFPLISIVVVYIIPNIDRDTEGVGVWLGSQRGWQAFAAGAVVSAVVVPIALVMQERSGEGSPAWINPATVLLAAIAVVAVVNGYLGRSTRLAVLTLAGAGTVAIALLTIVGMFMRGPSWSLLLPGGAP